jgi:ubiquinone/menaquinone biosynthesis C-methylase UbiE
VRKQRQNGRETESIDLREEILAAAEQVAKGNEWYVSDQLAGQVHGVYRHNMRLRYEYVANHLQSIATEGKTLIDLGCGDGQWSLEVSKRYNVKLIGVDYNQLRLERYKQNVPQAEAHFGSCLEIPLENDCADIVMFHQVLEHIPEPGAALREIHRILRAGGWLILSVPNEGTWLKQKVQYRWIEPHSLETTDHVNFYTRSSLRELLMTNQFTVRQLDAIGVYFPHNGISRRLINTKASFTLGMWAARIMPVLRDCLFAWSQPIKELQ